MRPFSPLFNLNHIGITIGNEYKFSIGGEVETLTQLEHEALRLNFDYFRGIGIPTDKQATFQLHTHIIFSFGIDECESAIDYNHLPWVQFRDIHNIRIF